MYTPLALWVLLLYMMITTYYSNLLITLLKAHLVKMGAELRAVKLVVCLCLGFFFLILLKHEASCILEL